MARKLARIIGVPAIEVIDSGSDTTASINAGATIRHKVLFSSKDVVLGVGEISTATTNAAVSGIMEMGIDPTSDKGFFSVVVTNNGASAQTVTIDYKNVIVAKRA